MHQPSDRVLQFKDSIFGIMSAKAREAGAINLSQGFPDFDGPEFVKAAVLEEIKKGNNQYAPFPGTPNLRSSVSDYIKKYYDISYDPNTEITVSCGATEGIFLSILSTVNPGDEVIVFEPFYDSYVSSILTAGGIPVPICIKGPDFTIPYEELESKINSKTKLVIFNNPYNPVGRVFSKYELENLAKIIKKHDLLLISDEVYEFLTYDEHEHFPMASFEGMQERTLMISSAGKTFGLTGWKIGWVCAPERFSTGMRKLHQYITFSVSTPMQEGVAHSLKQLDSYIPDFKKTYQAKRDLFYNGMVELGLSHMKTQGTYFAMVPISNVTKSNDVDYAMTLIEKNKVAAIPPSAFYLESDEGRKYLRFCFAKKDTVIKEALKNLKELPT